MSNSRVEHDVESNISSDELITHSNSIYSGWIQTLNPFSTPHKLLSKNTESFTANITQFESIKVQNGNAILFETGQVDSIQFSHPAEIGKVKTIFDFSTCNNGFSQEFSISTDVSKRPYIQVGFNKSSISDDEFNCIVDKVIATRIIYKNNQQALGDFPDRAKKAYEQFRYRIENQPTSHELVKNGLIGFGAGFSETIIRQSLKQYFKNQQYTERQIFFLDLLLSDASTLLLSYITGSYFAFTFKIISLTSVALEEMGFESDLTAEVSALLLATNQLLNGNVGNLIMATGTICGAYVANLVVNKKEIQEIDIEAAVKQTPSQHRATLFGGSIRRRAVESRIIAPVTVLETPRVGTKSNPMTMVENFFGSFFRLPTLKPTEENGLQQRLKSVRPV